MGTADRQVGQRLRSPAGPITKVADFVPVLQQHIKKQGIKKDEWMISYGYDRSNFAKGCEILASELDPVFPDKPGMVIHGSNHGPVLNSAAFKAVEYNENTKTSPGGIINPAEPLASVMLAQVWIWPDL